MMAFARRIVAVLIGLCCAIGLLAFPVVANATTGGTEGVQEWFAKEGVDLVRAQAGDVFDSDVVDDPSMLTLGVPHRVAIVVSDKRSSGKPDAAFPDSDKWIAPIFKETSAVGIVTTDGGSATRRAHAKIVADVRLATEASAARSDTQKLIYDSELDAWFVFRDGLIEPGDRAGSNFVLGAIPFSTFMTQRDGVIAAEKSGKSVPATPLRPAVAQKTTTTGQVVVIVAALAALSVFSVAWLRWDQNRTAVQHADPVTHTRGQNRWDPFARARLLIHPQQSDTASETSTKE